MSGARRPVLAAAAILWIGAAVSAAAAGAQGAAAGPVRLLDVPYLAQTEALCGGAAAAMVMRFFGDRDAHADAFADLIEPAVQGIRGDSLAGRLRSRGWQATSFAGDAPLVQHHLGAGRPAIALIEDRPGRFHFVVVVAWIRDRVIVHDPARAPFRVLDASAFERAWSASAHWTLLVLPGDARPARAADPPSPAAAALEPCGGLVQEGVRLARIGDLDEAERVLAAAEQVCPHASGPSRERAGVQVLRRDWAAAASAARGALERDTGDVHARRILATSLFLQDDRDGALREWNAIGEPAADSIDVAGLVRTRHAVAARALGIEPGVQLTSERLKGARRRLAELPAAAVSRVNFVPTESGRASVEAVVVERPLVPWGPVALATIGVRALTDREATFALAGATGGGELLEAGWRWWERRPRFSIALTAPAPVPRAGTTWSLSYFDERQTYDAGVPIEESRQRAMLAIAGWATSRIRWQIGGGIDRFAGDRNALAIESRVDVRLDRDRLAFQWRGSAWTGQLRTAAAGAAVSWRSSAERSGAEWLAEAGFDAAGAGAPRALWAGAGTGQGRPALLRGHTLLRDGVIGSGVFGRRLAHGTLEWRRWIRPAGRIWRIAPAVFIDVAGAGRTDPGFDTRTHGDLGAGIRLAVPYGGVFRLDVGRGVRDGEMRVSAGIAR